MFQKIKRIVKFLLIKKYRMHLFELEQEGRIEKLRSVETPVAKVMLLRRKNREVGLFSDYIVFLRMIEQALECNYIPIIDRKTIKNVFLDADTTINTWELFFEQPAQMSIESIRDDMEVYVNNIPSAVCPVSIMHSNNQEIVNYWRKIAKNYIRLNHATQELVDDVKNTIIGDKRVLGVAIREGYIKLSREQKEKIVGHPIQADVEEMLELTRKYMEEWNCEYVFFTCQTKETETLFKDEFKEKALFIEKNRPSYDELLEGSKLSQSDKSEMYEHELKYLLEICLLANCTSFICSENSGSEAAFIMSKGFEHFISVVKGTY